MIDPKAPDLCPISQAAKLFPSPNGKKIHIATLWRWVQEGRRGIQLETVVVGGRRYTTPEAAREFCEALTSKATRTTVAPPTRSPGRRDRATTRANAELEAKGA